MNTDEDTASNDMDVDAGNRILLEHHDLPSLDTIAGLADTSKYFVDSLAKAKLRADALSEETARRSWLAQKAIDQAKADNSTLRSFKETSEFRQLRGRVCEAEKNVVIERDRYSRLLARYAELAERRAEDAKRIEYLQNGFAEYQKINEALANELEKQGQTLERLVVSMRNARQSTQPIGSRNPVAKSKDSATESDVAWSRSQLRSAISAASMLLANFDEQDRRRHKTETESSAVSRDAT